ncbi:MAG: type IV pilus secretin PilQ [Myxococcales bacterium]|nr:type IV pilus secretin PilQ [Myxococcales bacterium]
MRFSIGRFAFTLALLFASEALADGTAPVVATLDIEGGKDRAQVAIEGSFSVPDYRIEPLDDGKRIVIQVAGAKLDPKGVVTRGAAGLVVRSTASSTAGGVRVELALSRAAPYRARATRGRITVNFDTSGDLQPKSDRSASKRLELQHVILERRNGRDRVVAELSGPAEFRVLPGQGGQAKLEIVGAKLGQSVARRLEGDPASAVRSVEVSERGGRTLLSVDRRAGSSGTAIREGNRIVWLFAKPERATKPGRFATRTVARQEAVVVDGEDVAAFLSDVPMQIGGARKGRKFTGRRIDLDLKSADIHNILRLLSEVGNVNIITSDDVSGSVTIKMKNVPWDQALDVILTAKELGMVRKGNLLRVAPQSVLEKERELAIARKKQQMELAPLETRLIPVSYADAGDLSGRAQELISERGNVSVDDRTNILVVRDVRGNLDDIEELVRSLDSQTPQVLIEARIVEATTSFAHEVGIQWGGSIAMSSATGNPTGLIFPHDVTVAGGATDAQTPTQGLSPFTSTVPNPNFVVNYPSPAGTGQGGAIGISLGSLAGTFNLAVRLSAFETSGHVRIISSPRILTLDNAKATIEQGTMIPYSQVSAQGVQTAFQNARLALDVTPHVTNDGAVAMDVSINRDEPDFNQTSARGDPTILRRSAKTNLLVQDGHTAVIGGIYTRNSGRGLTQVPFFGDIPIIGILFRQEQTSDARNELLIFLTPRIVNRADALSR